MLQEGFAFPATKNATEKFTLVLGGRYLFCATGIYTTAAVQVLGPDGTTYLDIYALESGTPEKINSQATATGGAVLLDLSPGSYQFKLAGNSSTAADVSIARCPLC